MLAVGHNELCKHSGRGVARGDAELRLEAVYHPVNRRGGAEDGAGLHAVVGVRADAAPRGLERDAGQERGPARERVEAHDRAGQDGPAEHARVLVNDVDRRRRVEVGDNQRRLPARKRADGDGHEVGAELRGVVYAYVEPRPDSRADNQRLRARQEPERLVQYGDELRHDAGHGRAGEAPGLNPAHGQRLGEEGRVLVRGAPRGREGRAGPYLPVLYTACGYCGVSGVQGQEHQASLLTR